MATASDRLELRNLFASPLVIRRWGDDPLNAELRAAILAHRDRVAGGVAQSNIGGWHSEYGRLEFCGPAGLKLVERATALTDEATARVLQDYGQPPQTFAWGLQAWANVNARGDFNRVHTHPGSTWSGVYYVDMGIAGSKAQAAPLQVFDPCQGRANTFLPQFVPNNITLRPEAGLMLLFPSYVGHMVFPHEGDGPRISIAFNMRREPFP
jgi:uncharacterized protein (TIGR02466 family)